MATKRTKKTKKEDDALSIPDFLLRRKGDAPAKTRVVRAAVAPPVVADPLAGLPGADKLAPGAREFVARQVSNLTSEQAASLRAMKAVTCAYVLDQIRQCRMNPRWIADEAMQRVLDESAAEEARLSGERGERAKERLAAIRRPKKVNPLAGLVSLRDVLKKMGDGALSRRHARMAVESANLTHTQFHFEPGAVTLARLERVLRSYVPPVKARASRHEHDPAAVITFSGKNPKKEGSSAHARWVLLIKHSGQTVEKFLANGGNPTTLANAVARGSATLSDGAAKQQPERKEEKRNGKESKDKSSGSRAERGRRGK